MKDVLRHVKFTRILLGLYYCKLFACGKPPSFFDEDLHLPVNHCRNLSSGILPSVQHVLIGCELLTLELMTAR